LALLLLHLASWLLYVFGYRFERRHLHPTIEVSDADAAAIRDAKGADTVRNCEVGFAGELYENGEEGFRTKRMEDGMTAQAGIAEWRYGGEETDGRGGGRDDGEVTGWSSWRCGFGLGWWEEWQLNSIMVMVLHCIVSQ
jgi:hypothetical protein